MRADDGEIQAFRFEYVFGYSHDVSRFYFIYSFDYFFQRADFA